MKNFITFLLILFPFSSQLVFAQCGNEDESIFLTVQNEVDELSSCEIFQGTLNITGTDINNLTPLSNLLTVSGSLNIYDTSIESIAALSNLMNAIEINIYNNDLLVSCCPIVDWQFGLELGTIDLINIQSNGGGCESNSQAQAVCLGLIAGCTDQNAVNYLSIANFDDGSCLNGPDLQVSTATILNSLYINTFTSQDECLVQEGCITGTGTRATLRFTTTISNYGNEDFYIGETGGPDNLNPNFYWDDCHGHAHFEGYANYQIYTYPDLQPLGIGHKNGWCVMDLGGAVSSETPEYITNPSSCSFTYGCSIMGISKGCSDTYGSGISCQWVDITDLYDGEYVLAVSTNIETDNYTPIPEIDYSNNVVYVKFEFEGDEILSATEFDGSMINDICNSNFSSLSIDLTEPIEPINMPTAYLGEYYSQSIQLLNFSDFIYLENNLPLGLDWACEEESCYAGSEYCIGIFGIPTLTGTSSVSLSGLDPSFESIIPLNFSVQVPIYGCIDSLALNFNVNANVDDGSCEFPNLGCTDPFSLNYDEDANTEDGSCDYCAEGIEWVAQIDMEDSYGDGWNGNYYYLINEWGDTTATGTLDNGYSGTDLICLSPGCYIMSVPSEGGWPYEVSWQITSAGFPDLYLNGDCPDFQPLSFLTECDETFGCTDESALNYNDAVEFDDGSCIYPVYGCTDETALNYNESATSDDESCQYTIVCDNFNNPNASYVLFLYDTYGDGWNGNDFIITELETGGITSITMESGSESISSFCLNDGCYLITVDGGSWQSEISWDLHGPDGNSILTGECPYEGSFSVNSNCETEVFGCTDPEALNYDEFAETDDESCVYPLVCDEGFNIVLMELQTDPYPGETSWDLVTEDGETLLFVNNFTEANSLYTDSVCVSNDATITFSIYDTYGDGLTSSAGNGEFHFYVCGVQVFSGSSFEYLYSGIFTGCDGAEIIVFGCIDESAINYSPDANTDDGSCEYEVVLGCTDSEAVNFNIEATDDDGSCEFISCEFYETLVAINLFSSGGNGWEGIHYQLSSFDGSYSTSGSLDDTFEGTDYYCLSNGCYLFTTPEYLGLESFNWSILIEGKKLVSGEAGTKESFGVNEICTLIMGCTDVDALNFNVLANSDDGSCQYSNGGSQEIVINAGWNMISSYIESDNMDIAIVTLPLIDNMVIMKDNLGMAYLPEWDFNGIGNWDNLQGYKIKMTAPFIFEMSGVILLPEENPLTLNEGWNMISYLRNESAPLDVVFQDVEDDVVIVKNAAGLAYLPEWSFNGIGEMTSGQGYQVKMYQLRELIYLSNTLEYRGSSKEVIDNRVKKINFDSNTGSNMHFVIPKDTWPLSISSEDEIYVYDAQKTLVGASRVTLPNTVVTIWGNDLTTDEKDGLYPAEEWSVAIYSNEAGKLINMLVSAESSPVNFQQDEILIAESLILNNYNKSLALYNSVPNPAQEKTEIGFYVAESKDLNLTLYNILGEHIKVLSSGFKESGYHSVQLSVELLEPGSYFYQLQSDSEKITKRLQVIK